MKAWEIVGWIWWIGGTLAACAAANIRPRRLRLKRLADPRPLPGEMPSLTMPTDRRWPRDYPR